MLPKAAYSAVFITNLLILCGLATVTLGSELEAPWPMFHGNLRHTGLSPYHTKGNVGVLAWRCTLSGAVISSPSIGPDGVIYVGTFRGFVYAIWPNGTVKWRFPTGEPIISSPLIGPDGTVYIGSFDDNLYAIGPDGTLKWKYSTEDDVRSPPVLYQDRIYFGSNDRKVYVLSTDGELIWDFDIRGIVTSSPAVFSDGKGVHIYVTSWNGKLYSLKDDGTYEWAFSTNGIILASPAVDENGIIYVASMDNSLYAINPDGTEKWKYTVGARVESSPAIGPNGTIYFGAGDCYLYAVNPDGTMKWRYKTEDAVVSSPAVSFEGTVYVGSWDGYLYAINPNGTLKWKYKTDGAVRSSPAIAPNGTVYVGSDDGYLYAFEGTTLKPPHPPTNLTATEGDGYLLLRWSAPADDGGAPITAYKIYRGEAPGGETLLAEVGDNVTLYNDTDVSNGRRYYYRVSAVNEIGEGEPSEEVNATPAGVPSAPRNLTAVVGDGTVNLTWEAPEDDGGAEVVAYRVYRDGEFVARVEVMWYRDEGLENGRGYYYQVSAVNRMGEGELSEGVNATPIGPPSAPRNVQAVQEKDGILLTWDPPEDDGGSQITLYKILRDGAYYAAVPGNTTEFLDENVSAGRTYRYSVKAVNDAGMSELSSEVLVEVREEEEKSSFLPLLVAVAIALAVALVVSYLAVMKKMSEIEE